VEQNYYEEHAWVNFFILFMRPLSRCSDEEKRR